MDNSNKTEAISLFIIITLGAAFLWGIMDLAEKKREMNHKVNMCVVESEPRIDIKDYCEAVAELQLYTENNEEK